MRKAQMLIENIIGIGLITLILSAIIPLFMIGIRSGSESTKQETARLLAQETLQSAEIISQDDWNNIYRPLDTNNKGDGNLYHVTKSGQAWVLAAGREELTLDNIVFGRYLTIDNVSRDNQTQTGKNGQGEIQPIFNQIKEDPSTQKVTVKVEWTGSKGIEIIRYLTRNKNSLWQQSDWTGGSGQSAWPPGGNGYFSKTNVSNPAGDIDTSTVGEIKLSKVPSGTINQGNQFIISTRTNVGRLNSQSYKDALRFTASKNGTLNRIRLYVDEVQGGNRVVYRYGIQAENLANPEEPSGVFLSSGTASFNNVGWQTVSINPIALTMGKVYYIVISYDSGTAPSGNRFINFRSTTPNNGLIPKDGLADARAGTLHYNGTSWVNLNQQPIYVLGLVDNTFEGNPYDNFEVRSVYAQSFEGEAVTISQDEVLSGIGLYVAGTSRNVPADSLYVTVYDITNDQILTSPNEIFLAPDALTTTFSWKEHMFSSPIDLKSGNTYRIYFSSPGASANRSFQILCESSPNTPDYIGINWQGSDAVTTRSADGGTSFSSLTYVDLAYYLKIVSENVYVPYGELISSSFDTANPRGAGFNRIFWKTLSLPAGTTVKFQLAANDDNSTWNWSGPDGLATWYTFSTGENIWTGLYWAQAATVPRFLRYKVRLETSNQLVTPRLDNININWSK